MNDHNMARVTPSMSSDMKVSTALIDWFSLGSYIARAGGLPCVTSSCSGRGTPVCNLEL